MPDTHGFAVVVEAGPGLLRKVLRGAWKSAACPLEPGEEGRIPENVDIDETDGLRLGSYVVQDAQIQIPQDELDAVLAPDIDGAELKLGLHLQVEIKDPPVPSASLFNMTADLRAKVPIGVPAGEKNVYFFLDGLPRTSVTVDLTSGDPLASKIDTLMRDYVHKLYEADSATFPHTITKFNVVWPILLGSFKVDVYSELYDDEANAAHRIEVSLPDPTHVAISIPLYLRIYNIRRSGTATLVNLKSPMGIETRMIINAQFESPPGSYTARLSTATVIVDPLTPAGPEHGEEGKNYTDNKSALSSVADLDAVLQEEIKKNGEEIAHAMGDQTILVPTVEQIEQAVEDYFHTDLEGRNRISVWTPQDVPDVDFTANDVSTRALADALVIGLNSSAGADIGAISSFIPAGNEFALGLSAAQVNAAIAKSREDNDLEDGDLPKRITTGDHQVDLKGLSVFLVDGAIRVEGDVTVIDAILGSIDVDATFRADVGLQWVDNADGTQRIENFNVSEPEVDPEESVAMWVITLILAVLTFGLGGGIIAALILLVVQLIVNGIASSIGGAVVKDEITGKVVGMGGWPARLTRIGRVTTRFLNPIAINKTGMVISGTVEVISSCEDTAVAFADSGSSYSGSATSALTLAAQTTHPDASYQWLPGDGSPAVIVQNITHTYLASGLYIAKHSLAINQPGGVTTRHFAEVKIRNVPPKVVAGVDLTVNEGEVVTLVGHFWDAEYTDTHESTWIFGDDQPSSPGVIAETNTPPQAAGTSIVQHAWCQNGLYTVTLAVRDQNGGMTVDTLQVKVLNVPPVVEAGPSLYAYRCMAITLIGKFEDPGWCDTHVAFWDFGDCSEIQTAIVRETNTAPAARGTAEASHIYEKCGTVQAECTVIDQDGAVGKDTTTIHVVHLLNPGFESGFRQQPVGKVGNHWEPYAGLSTRTSLLDPKADLPGILKSARDSAASVYACEECIVHGGQRSQRITPLPRTRWGVYQKLGANPDWQYQMSAWCFLAGTQGGQARLGLDPAGGSDPSAPGIVWSSHGSIDRWHQLAERVVATGQAITIFLEVELEAGEQASGFFDDVEFVAIQPFCPEISKVPCKPCDREPQKPERPSKSLCIDFDELPPGCTLDQPYARGGFAFSSVGNSPLRTTANGLPLGKTILQLDSGGVLVTLPSLAVRVVAYVTYMGGKPPIMRAQDGNGDPAGEAIGTTQAEQILEIRAAAMARLLLVGQEAALVKVCIERSSHAPGKGRETTLAARGFDDLLRAKAVPIKDEPREARSVDSDQPKSKESHDFSITDEDHHRHS